MNWLSINRGDAPLLVALPHTGTALPEGAFHNEWLARRDTDWWVDQLYAFAADMGATIVRSDTSRSIIDLNRDPTGHSLYPGQATTGLVPAETFDGEPLGPPVVAAEVEGRLHRWFHPYHNALAAELKRLRTHHKAVVLYDAHSIRSRIPRLFDGELPLFNIGTDGGRTCAAVLQQAVYDACARSGLPTVVNGRFRGGWTTRHYGDPERGIHAVQMELAMRAYLDEPTGAPTPDNWPPVYDAERAAPLQTVLRQIVQACLDFAGEQR